MSLVRSLLRLRKRNRKLPPIRNKVHFEQLEPRLLLSDITYTAAAGTAVDLTLRLQKVDDVDTLQLVNNVDQSVVESQALYDTSAVVITGADQDDTLRLDLDFDDLLDSLLMNFHGGLGYDTLFGPTENSTWQITGEDSGTIASVNFSEVENLIGAADNQDTFIFEEGGSLSGKIEGGAGGFDSLIIAGETYDSIIFSPSGPNSGIVDLDGKLIAYSGLEPVLVNVGDVTDVIYNLTDDPDQAIIENPGSGMQIRSTNSTPTFETTSFNIPTGSLTINGQDGDDSVTVASNLIMPGADLTINVETITVSPSVMISTRQISAGGDYLTDPSTGDSGDITLAGKTITVGSGSKLLAHDDRGIPITLADQSSPAIKWTPGQNYLGVVQVATSEAGSGMTVDIVVEDSGEPTVTLVNPGTGYVVNEVVTFNDPVAGGSPITVRVSELNGGDITLEGKSTVELRPYTPVDPLLFETDNAESKIELLGATLKGRTVKVTATADTSKTTTEEDTPVLMELVDAGLLNFSEIFGWSFSKATAEVKVGAGTDIQADTDVTISANANSESIISTLGFGLGFTYAESEAISKAYVEGGAKVSAGNKLTLESETTNKVEAAAYGVSQGPSINFALTDATSNADAYIANGATISATTLDVTATITNEIETKAEPFEVSGGSKGLAIAISSLTSTANAYIDAEVSIPGKINIAATTTTENKTSANAEPKSSFSGIESIYEEAPKVWDAIKNYFSDKDKKPDEKTQASDEKPAQFDVSAAVVVAEASNTTNAYIGSDADVRSGGSVLVTSEIEDDFRTQAVSDAEEANTVISASVAVAKTTDTANAYIADGAEVSASALIDVSASTTVPNPADDFKSSLPSDFWGWFQAASDLEGFLQDAVTSYVRSSAQADDDTGKFALSGSVNILAFENTANAYIGAGAKINQDSTYTASAEQTVEVEANNTIKTINLAGVLGFIDLTSGWVEDGSFKKDKLSEFYGTSGKASLGGTYNQVSYKTVTQAVIKDGADVHAEKEVIVEATSDQFDFLLAVAGGQAEKFGISGAVSFAKQNSLTLAQVESGARITTGNLSITAKDTTNHINVTGGVLIGKQVGIDGSVGINEINRETHAVIGNFQGRKGGPWEVTFNQNGERDQIAAAGEADFNGTLIPSTVTGGDAGTQELQRIDNNSTDGSFRLSFGGDTTGPIAHDASAAEVENALNTLASVKAAGGVKVTVAPGGDPALDTVNVSGNVALSATSTGNFYVFSLAASVITPGSDEGGGGSQQPPGGQEPEEPKAGPETEDPLDGETLPRLFGDAEGAPTEDEEGKPAEPSKGQGKTGIGIAGDVSINTVNDSAMAYINDQGKFTSEAMTLTSTNDTNLISAAGAAAVTTTDGLSGGIAGSFSKIVLEGKTQSYITGATIDTDALTLDAHRTGDLFALTAGVGVTPKKKGIAIAGSVSLNKIQNDTETRLDRVQADVSKTTPLNGNIFLKGYDDSEMLTIAGSISYGGKAGIGAAVALNKIYNTTKATITGSTLKHDGTLTLQGINDNEIISAAAGIAASGDTLGASGMVSLNFIDNTAEASISRSTNRVEPPHTNGSISLWAKDDSLIMSLAGSVAGAKTIGIGGAVAYNSIENTITAFVDNSRLDTSGGLSLLAESLEKIKTISAAGAGAEKFSLAGAVSLNFMDSTISARISNSPDIDATGTISVTATDQSTIGAIAGSVAGAGKVTIGASVGYNDISNDVTSYILSSNIASQGNILIGAGESAEVTSIAAGGAGAGKVAIGGSVTINDIDNTTKAYIDGNATVVADGSVVVAAHDDMDMLLVAGVVGGAGTAAIGVSNTTVVTDNTVESYINNAQVTARGKQGPVDVAAAEKNASGNRTTESLTGLAVTATSWEDIQSFAVVGQGAGKAAIAGSATVNVLTETTKAYIGPGATINGGNNDTGATQDVSVVAYDDTDILSVAGALSGAGTAGIGAGADVGVIEKETQAYIWADEVHASRDVKVQSNSTEDILSISASIGGGGTAGIAGSAGVYVMDITTRAFIGDDPFDLIDLTAMTTTVIADGSVLVSAVNDAEIDIIAGNIAGAGTAGIGVSAAVTVIKKTTEAFLGPNADVTGKGGGDGVTAHAGTFNISSVTDSGSDDFAELPAAQFIPTTAIDQNLDTITIDSGHGFKTGQALVYSNGGNPSIGVEGGETLEDGQTYYVIASDTDAALGADQIKLAETEQDAREGKAIDLADPTGVIGTHSLTEGIPSAPNGEVTAPGQQLDTTANTNFDNKGGNDLNPDTDTQTKQRTSVADPKTIKGVAITAINKDDIETIGVSGGGAGTVAVNIGGSVNVLSSNTSAFVASGAKVNKDTDTNDGITSDQSVLVAAGNDLYHMGIGGAISIAGTAAVTPGAEVTVITNNTKAYVDDGALVKAEKDIEVTANASEDILAIAAGVGGSGTVGIGVAASVLVMDNTTYAYIGDSDKSDLTGATANAGGNILVSAKDTTETFMIAGSLGLGFGAAGIGGAAGVSVIDKDTQAFIGHYSVVDAKGNGGYLADLILDGTNTSLGFGTETEFRGLAVQAHSKEDLFVIGASAGGGLYAGLAGGVTVEIIDSGTKAYIGEYADINKETTNENEDQSVNVSAANDFSVFALGGGLGIGAAGIAGGVDVGILRNNTTAYIGDNAEVYARHDVDVNALSREEIDSFGISVGAGLAGISGSVSVWSIGSGFKSTYAYTEKDSDGKDGATQSETPLNKSDLTSVLSSESDKNSGKEGDPGGGFSSNLVSYNATDQNGADDDTPDNTQLLGTSTSRAGNRVDSGTSGSLIGDSMAGANLAGTTAYVGTGATVVAEDDINIRAIDRLEFDVIVGSAALGGLGLGGSVAVLNVDSNVQAFIRAEATVNAGTETTDDILVHAESVEDLYGLAIAGQLSAGLSLGAQVIVFNDNSSQTAFIGFSVADEANSATIDQAGGTVTVEAKANRTIKAEPYGGGLSLGGSIGASVAIVNVGGHTKAYIDDARIGQGSETVGAVSVTAESVADVEVYCLAVSGGISFGISGSIAIADYSPTIEASIINDADITVANDVTIESHSRADVETDALGVNVGALAALGASVAISSNEPTMNTFIANASVTATSGSIILRSIHNYDATGTIRLDQGADAYATAGSGSLVLGAAGTYTEADSSAALDTYVAAGATIRAGDEFSLLSKTYNKALASSEAVGVGLGLAAGVSLAKADNSGLNLAHFDGTSLTGQVVVIMAETLDYAKAHTLAGAGALLASGVGADSEAIVGSTTQAYVGSGTNIRAFNSFLLSAEETPEALADSEGVSVGGFGLSVGVSLSSAETRPSVSSYIGSNSNIVTGIFITGDPTLTFRSEAKLTPDPNTHLDFIPGIVTQVTKTMEFDILGFHFSFPYTVNEIAGAQITRDNGSWLGEGFAPGQTINIGGAVSSRGSYKIKEVTDSVITLENGYQVAEENVVPSALVLMTADLTDTIHRDNGNWQDDGFREGHSIQVSGSNDNDGVYRVKSISADGKTLTLTTNNALTNETAADLDVSVAPEVSMVGNPDLIFNTEAYFLGGANLTFQRNAQKPDEGTITRDDGIWGNDGFASGYNIEVYGSSKDSIDNDGEYLVLGMSDKTLTVKRMDGNPINFIGNITPLIRQELPDTITRDSGSWAADGFQSGQGIRITNSLLNDGTYRILSVSSDGKVLTLDPDIDGNGTEDDLNQLTNSTDSDVMITAAGEGLGGLAGDLTVIALQSLPLSGISAKADGSASSGSLLLSGAGTDNQAINNSSVYAYIGSGTSLRFTGNADVNASTFATQRTSSDGVSVGALAGGASLADANSTSDTQAYLETLVSVTGDNLRIFAGGADDSEAEAEVGFGGVIAGGDAIASTTTSSTAKAYLAPKTGDQPLSFNVRSLEVKADHTARFDSVAVSKHAQLAGASLSRAMNHAVSNVEASIGDSLVIEAEDITVEAINRTEKPLRSGERANLRGASGGLADLPLSNTSYTQFTSDTLVKVGDGVQLTTVSGDREKPGKLALLALNDIEAWDYVLLDSGGVIALPIAFSVINGEDNTAAVEVGGQAAIQSDGDIDLSARTDARLNSQTQVSTYGLAGAGWGGSGAFLNADNLVTVKDGATFKAGRNIYLLAGTERMGDINHIDLDAKTDIWNNTVVPLGPLGAEIADALPGPTPRAEFLIGAMLDNAGKDVPAEANLNLRNRVTVEPNVAMTGVGDAYFYATEGDVEVTGKGSAKDLYSEVLGALSGGALEFGGGRSIIDSVSGVEMNGSIEVGIRNKQRLTIEEDSASTFDSYNSYKIIATTQDDGVSYTVREESLLLNLVADLERAQELRAQYDDYNPNNVSPQEAAFDAEIARIERQLADMGFSSQETFNGTFTYVTDQEIQTIFHNGTQGAFTLSFEDEATAPIFYNASAEDVKAALNALSTIQNVGGVDVTGADGGWAITFNVNGDRDQITAAALEASVVERNSLVRYIVVDPILAQSANVNVKGDYLVGGGRFKARGQTEITIINDTQYYLRTNDLIIPDEEGGRIWFNNQEVSTLDQIEDLNQDVPSQAILSLTVEPGTPPGAVPEPPIYIENVKGLREVSPGVTLPAPDIELVGNIRNLMGSVTVVSQGSINASGAIQAGRIDLGAEGSFVQSYVPGLWNAGGDPKSAYSQVVGYYEYWGPLKAAALKSSSATRGQIGPNTALENQAAQQLFNQAQTGGIIVGDSVFISARYLNINGKIQSGQPMQTLTLPSSLDQTIGQLKAQYQSQLISGKNPNPLLYLNPWLPNMAYGSLSPVKAFYDVNEDRIELDPIVVKGGYIELVGEIISTGNGKIEIRDGYGNIDVRNETSYDLLVQEVDVGTGAKGKLVITDLAASRINAGVRDNKTVALQTIFTLDGSSVRIEDNSPTMEAPGTIITGAPRAQYSPVQGVRYEWVRGQAFTLIEKVTYRSSSWLGVDELAKNPANIYKTQTLFKDENADGKPDLVPLLQGEYTRVDPGNNLNYDYAFNQVVTDGKTQVGQAREWSEKSGFWGLGRTYYTEVTYETGLKNFHRHSLKADKAIDIEFIGADKGQVSITSAKDLLIGGSIKNATGSTTLVAGAEIRVISDAARIISKEIDLTAQAGIGKNSPLILDTQDEGWLSAKSDTGDVQLVEVTGDLMLKQVTTGGAGRIDLEAPGSLLPLDGTSLIRGNKVELTSRAGGIGDANQWLRVDSAINVNNAEDAGLEALAKGNIYVQETAGDLYLVRAESVDSDGNPTGDVNLWASNGSIRDYRFEEELNEDTFNELLALADEVGLRGSAAQARADANVAAFKATKEAEYHSYWGLRNQQRVTVSDASNVTLTFDAINNTITRDTGAWDVDGFRSNHRKIYITGSVNGNDGAYDVTNIVGNTIYLAGTLAASENGRADVLKVIGEIPAPLVTIELTDGQEAYLRSELGYDDTQVAAYETNLSEQYRYLDSVYGSEGDFEDLAWTYTPTLAEETSLKRGAQWDDDALTLGISPALFKKTSGVLEDEKPNVKGVNIYLRASGGGLGSYKASLAIDLSGGFSGLSAQEKVALAAAERDDVTYFGDDTAVMFGSPTLNFNAANRTITRNSGSWVDDYFEAGRKIWIEGASVNSGLAFMVKTVSATVLTLENNETLTGENSVQGVKVGQFGTELEELISAHMSGTPTLTFYFDAAVGTSTITRDDTGSWVTDGFLAGKKIWVAGTAFNNGQAFLIEDVKDQVITISSSTPVQDEEVAGARVGQVLVARMTIDQREDVDVETPGEITIDVEKHLFLGSEIDINLNQVAAGEQIILRSGKSILNAADDGVINVETSGPAGNLILEAGEGSIGAYVDPTGNPVIRPILISLYDGASLTARAEQDIYIKEIGDMYVADVYAPFGRVELEATGAMEATGSMYDALANSLVKVESQSLDLNAAGSIGTPEDFFEIDQGPMGVVNVQAGGDIYLHDPVGNLNIRKVESTGGDVSLWAAVSILDAAGENNVTDVVGNSITLRADSGTIGLPFLGDLDINTQYSEWGTLTGHAGLNAYLFEESGDLAVNEVTASGETFLFSPGSILDGRSGPIIQNLFSMAIMAAPLQSNTEPEFNVEAEKAVFTATGDVGGTDTPILMKTTYLEGTAEGSVYIVNEGALTVGDATAAKSGIVAGGETVLTIKSPVTFTERMIAEDDITVTAVDSDGVDDDIVLDINLASSGPIQSTGGAVTLKAGDDFQQNEGTTIQAFTSITILGDSGDADAGVGSTITINGTVNAPEIRIYGEADNDSITLTSMAADVAMALYGNAGSDTFTIAAPEANGALLVVYGDTAASGILPNPGDDVIDASGSSLGMIIYGGAGNDSITGGSDGDLIAGGSGNDLLQGGGGADIILGDSGVDVDLTTRTVSIVTSGMPGQDDFDVPGSDEIHGGAGNDTILGDHGVINQNTISINPFNNILTIESVNLSKGVNDTISGDEGEDILIGGTGGDDIHGGNGSDLIFGDNVRLERLTAEEQFTYSALDIFGDDEIHGGSGDDEMFGQLGVDTLHGDDGHDVMFGDFGSITRVTDQQGNPLLNPNGSWRKEFLLVSPESGDGDLMYGGDGDDIMFGGAGIDTIYGDAGDDYMEGNIGGDTMYGGQGEDDMIGGSSDLTVPNQASQASRSDGSDMMDGGAGHDVLLGDNGRISRRIDAGTNQFMRYTVGNNGIGTGLGLGNGAVIRDIVLVDLDEIGGSDVMHGGEDDDIIHGGLGNDFMYGDAGNDEMHGELGIDTMDGGAGDDGMLGDKGTLIGDILDGSTETTLTIPGGALNETVNVAGTVRWYATLEAGIGGDDIMLGGEGNDAMHGGFGDDVITGGGGDDALFGDLGNDRMNGGADSDHLYGGSGDDTMDKDAGAGADILYGGDGSDSLYADIENDRLIDWMGPRNTFNRHGFPTVIVSPSRWVRQFLLDLAASDGATNPNDEIVVVVPGEKDK